MHSGCHIHADDAESHCRRAFCICTMSSILVGNESPWDVRLLLYCTDNQRCLDETFDTLDAWVCWGLAELATGIWSGVDPFGQTMASREHKAGKPIAEGWRAILMCHKGDEKYMQRAYHFQGGWVGENICYHCRAKKSGPNCYTLHGKHAPHRGTKVSWLM